MTNETNKEELSTFEMLKRIQAGSLNPRTLTEEQRQECVELLRLEGQTHAAIAELLKWNIKTIKRDWNEIRSRNAKKPTPEFALRHIAELIEQSGSKHDHLTRMARGDDGTVQERSQAEYYAFKVLSETTQLLQTMGYLPSKATKFMGDVYHHHDDDRDPKEMRAEIDRIEKIMSEEGIQDPAMQARLEALRKKVDLAEVDKQITDLSANVADKTTPNKEDGSNG